EVGPWSWRMVEELGGPDFCRAPGPLGFLPGQPVPSEILVQGSGVAVMVLQHSAERVPVRDSPTIREHDHVPPGEHELRVGQTEELVVEGALGRPDRTGLAGRIEKHHTTLIFRHCPSPTTGMTAAVSTRHISF